MLSRPIFSTILQQKERVSKCALAVVLAGCFLVSSPADSWSQSAPIQTGASDTSFAAVPENKRFRILLRMIKAKVIDEAERLLQTAPLTGKHAQNRTLFLTGLIAKSRGDYDLAEKNFRTVLANDPKLTMVRAELAHTLFLAKNDDSAKHHLQLLSDAAPTPEAAKQFDRFIDAIDARRPWKLSAYASMAPSTNFNNGTTRQTIIIGGLPFTVDANSQVKSGIGYRGGANASYTFHPGKDLSLIVGAGLNFTEYAGKTYDDRIISQNVSVVRKYKSGQVSIGLTASQRWSGADEFILEVGPQVTITHKINQKVRAFAKFRHLRTKFKLAEYRNGGTSTADFRFSYGLSADTVLYALVGGQRTGTRRNYLDFWSGYGGLALYKELPFGITYYGEGKLTKKFFDGDFPLLGEPQEDTRFNFNASITKRDFSMFGLAPRLEYTYTKSISNSAFSRYSSHGLNLSLTKAF